MKIKEIENFILSSDKDIYAVYKCPEHSFYGHRREHPYNGCPYCSKITDELTEEEIEKNKL